MMVVIALNQTVLYIYIYTMMVVIALNQTVLYIHIYYDGCNSFEPNCINIYNYGCFIFEPNCIIYIYICIL